jgi:serine/threonine-protein kinase ATR
VTPEAARLLDGINIHAYSYVTQGNGKRKAVHPEHPSSTFWEILNAIRWRDTNMPGKKIYLSEWGWDSDGGGEECTHDECVSEQAAASYAVRAALIALRLGIERTTWFFYANENQASSLYSRSGLTASKSQGFAKKRTFHALQALVAQAGGCYFDKIIREDETAWVYQFADKYGNPNAIVSWRPVDGDQTEKLELELKTNLVISETIRLDGAGAAGTQVPNPQAIKGGFLVENYAVPTLFKIAPQ